MTGAGTIPDGALGGPQGRRRSQPVREPSVKGRHKRAGGFVVDPPQGSENRSDPGGQKGPHETVEFSPWAEVGEPGLAAREHDQPRVGTSVIELTDGDPV